MTISRKCVPFTPFDRELSKSTIAIVTAGGVHLRDQEGFNIADELGDLTYREIPPDVDSSQLMVTHHHYNHKDADEVFVPVVYVVKEREWMYRISQNNNKVPLEKLEQWNNVTNGDIKPGMELIVGYLKVKGSQSPLASQATSVRTSAPVAKAKEVTPKVEESVAVNKPEEKSSNSVVVAEHSAGIKDMDKLEAPKADPKAEEKPIVDKPADKPEVKATENKPVLTQTSVDTRGGYFKTQYDETGKGTNGAAGVFRSTSGWQDGKYYALMNNIPVGTIIKVANPSNGKTVYAKVLGNLPDMKESAGLTLRISDAAATELGLASNKFPVSVRY